MGRSSTHPCRLVYACTGQSNLKGLSRGKVAPRSLPGGPEVYTEFDFDVDGDRSPAITTLNLRHRCEHLVAICK